MDRSVRALIRATSAASLRRQRATIATMAAAAAPTATPFCKYDPASFANVDVIKVTHMHLALRVDFERKVLAGRVTHTLTAVSDHAKELVLDAKNITIQNVTTADGKTLDTHRGTSHEAFGTPLHVHLDAPLAAGASTSVFIDYETGAGDACLAAQWLEPAQTVGKTHPYLFTQCQAIHARTLVPCQDTPSIKVKYTAEVSVPRHLRALMSAVPVAETETSTHKVCRFDQKIAIPSYLLALAVGNLVGRKVGPRTTVWSEPEVVEAAAWEFAETETFIATGEKLLTPYVWGVYDLLILPSSFPYGGMENPCITFVTPSLLAGDRSLVDVVAHEIAHSWTGNLVTSANWEHFWLNEGFTMMVQRKIMGRLRGETDIGFSAIIGTHDLREAVEHYESIGQRQFTRLVPDLKGIDPDDAFSTVPYEKGFHLLYHLEQLVGPGEPFEGFLRDHVTRFSHRSITTEDFKANLYAYFKDKHDVLDSVDWNAWLYGEGMPPVENKFDGTLADACAALAKSWHTSPDAAGFKSSDIKSFTSTQLAVFLGTLNQLANAATKALSVHKLERMEELYGFFARRNAEIRNQWLLLCLASGWDVSYTHVRDFVTGVGRMKYVRPIYRAWAKVDREAARKTFDEFRGFYHPICSAMVEKDLS